MRKIREHLGLAQDAIGVSKGVYIGRLETGKVDCTQALQRQIAAALCCEVFELLSNAITDERLQQIEIAYRRQQLEKLEQSQDKKAGAA